MKIIHRLAFCSSVIVAGHATMAVPEDVSYNCQARELASGNSGRTGSVTVHASTDGAVTFGSPWKLDVKWEGDDNFLNTAGTACATVLDAGLPCLTERSGANFPFALEQFCGPGDFNDTRAMPHYVSETRLVMAPNFDHGHFYCAAHDAKRYLNIELTNCKSK